MKKEENNDLWNLVFHEDNLYYIRLQVFLTAHTLLVAAVSIAYSNKTSIYLILLISGLGIILSIVWSYLQIRSSSILRNLSALLKKEESKLFEEVYARKKEGLHRFMQTDLLTILPFLVAIFWLILLLIPIINKVT